MNAVFLIARIVIALYFLHAGFSHFKGLNGMTQYATSRDVPMPKVGVLATGIVLLLGGFGILLGVYTTWAVWGLVAFLVLVSFGVHHFWSDTEAEVRAENKRDFMKNLVIAAALLLALMIPAPWPLALF